MSVGALNLHVGDSFYKRSIYLQVQLKHVLTMCHILKKGMGTMKIMNSTVTLFFYVSCVLQLYHLLQNFKVAKHILVL